MLSLNCVLRVLRHQLHQIYLLFRHVADLLYAITIHLQLPHLFAQPMLFGIDKLLAGSFFTQ